MKIFDILIAFILLIISGCAMWIEGILFPNSAVLSIRQNLAMDIDPAQVEFHEDTHGGFHGDGEEIVIFTPNDAQIYKIYHNWENTPVDSEIAPLIFPETEYNGLDLAEYIPKAEGWWIYINRSGFSNGYSYNFSFAFFDGEKVYYYELDT